MFENTKAFSGFAVDDLAAAKQFYSETLGSDVTEENGLMTLHLAGDRPTLVYPKPHHEAASYTIVDRTRTHFAQSIDYVVSGTVRQGVAIQ